MDCVQEELEWGGLRAGGGRGSWGEWDGFGTGMNQLVSEYCSV